MKRKEGARKYFFLIGLSFEGAVLAWFSVYFGGKLDEQAGGGLKFTFLLVILSLIIWFYKLIRILKKL